MPEAEYEENKAKDTLTNNTNTENGIFKNTQGQTLYTSSFVSNNIPKNVQIFQNNQTAQNPLISNLLVPPISNSLFNKLRKQDSYLNSNELPLNTINAANQKNNLFKINNNGKQKPSLITIKKYLFKPLNTYCMSIKPIQKFHVQNIALKTKYYGLSKQQIRIKYIYKSSQQINSNNFKLKNNLFGNNSFLQDNNIESNITFKQNLLKNAPIFCQTNQPGINNNQVYNSNTNPYLKQSNQQDKPSDLQFHKDLNVYLLNKVKALELANQDLTKKNYQLQKQNKNQKDDNIKQVQRLKKQLNQANEKMKPLNKNIVSSIFPPYQTMVKLADVKVQQPNQTSKLPGLKEQKFTSLSGAWQYFPQQKPNQSIFKILPQSQSLFSLNSTVNIQNKSSTSQVIKKSQNSSDVKIKSLFLNEYIQQSKEAFIPKPQKFNPSSYNSYIKNNSMMYSLLFSEQNQKNPKKNPTNSICSNLNSFESKQPQQLKKIVKKPQKFVPGKVALYQYKKQLNPSIPQTNNYCASKDYKSKIAAGQLEQQDQDISSEDSFILHSSQSDSQHQY